MENDVKELNLDELEKIGSGFKTEMLNPQELAQYNQYLEQAKLGRAQAKTLLAFKQEMRNKYGKAIFDPKDYQGMLIS